MKLTEPTTQKGQPFEEKSDLNRDGGHEPKKPYRQILYEEIKEGVRVFRRPTFGLFLSAFSAGLDLGFSLFLMAVMHSALRGETSSVMARLFMANAYAVGFIFVVLGRSELFTEHTTLAVLPVLHRRASVPALARIWLVIYVANLLGGAAFAGIAVLTGPALGIIEPTTFGDIAQSVVSHPGSAILLSGLLAGWLMGLLSWLVTASRDTISQIVVVWLIATTIGFAQLHHCIIGSVEVLAGAFSGQGATLADLGHFLLWTTLGNALGGTFFVALLKYSHATQDEPGDKLGNQKLDEKMA